jgi:hypothetical protein
LCHDAGAARKRFWRYLIEASAADCADATDEFNAPSVPSAQAKERAAADGFNSALNMANPLLVKVYR